jgi:tetratricopeptide (TPR) repeat protein
VEQAEIERAKRKPTGSLDAYDYYLRGKASFDEWTREANEEALRLFGTAIGLDRDFASAYGMAALCYSQRKGGGWDRVRDIAEPERLALRAVKLGKDDAGALCEGGYTLAHVIGDLDTGLAHIDRALVLNPNLAYAWYVSGYVRAWRGEPDTAIEHLMRAMRLSPVDKRMSGFQNGIAFGHFVAGRYDDAATWAERAVRGRPNYGGGLRVIAASCALAERLPEAQSAMASIRKLDPTFRIADVRDVIPFRRAEDLARFSEGLRRAGLPE